MAIAFNAAADGGNNGGSSTSLTFAYTCSSGSNRLLAVNVLGDVTDNITGVTYNGVSMTLAAKLTPTGPDTPRWVYLFFLLAPATGSNNVIISANTTAYILAGAADYTGVNQTGQPDATTTHTGSGSIMNLTSTITTVADNSWAILAEEGGGGLPPTFDVGTTRRSFDAAFNTWGLFDSGGPITPAGSYTMKTDRGLASNTILHVIASFSPSGVAPAPPVNKIQRNWLKR